MAGRQRDAAKERFWRRVLEQWRDSGATIRGYCTRHRLSETSFHAWRRELARRDRQPQAEPSPRASFVPLHVVADPVADRSVAEATSAIEIVLPRGVVVRVPANSSAAAVHAVLSALGATTSDIHVGNPLNPGTAREARSC
jgi:hypothetical protein